MAPTPADATGPELQLLMSLFLRFVRSRDAVLKLDGQAELKTQPLARIMTLQDAIFQAKTSPGRDGRLSQQITLKIFESDERYHHR